MTVQDAPLTAGDGRGRLRSSRLTRSEKKKQLADGACPTTSPAEKMVRFAIDQSVPGVRVVYVAGELDLLTTPLLDQRMRGQIDVGGGHVVVDLSEVTFLGAAGLTSLSSALEAAARRDVQLHLTGADHRAVARPLQIVGLLETLDSHPTVEAFIEVIGGVAS